MINTNASLFRKDMFKILEQTIRFNETVNISTKNGNAVILSEEDYNGLIETVYLCSIPEMRDKIIEGMNTSIEACVKEEDVEW